MYTSKLRLSITDLSGHNNSRGRHPSEALWSGNSLLIRHTKYSCLLCLGLELRPSSLPIKCTSAQQKRLHEPYQVLSPEPDAHALVLPSQRRARSLAAARGLADRQQPQRHHQAPQRAKPLTASTSTNSQRRPQRSLRCLYLALVGPSANATRRASRLYSTRLAPRPSRSWQMGRLTWAVAHPQSGVTPISGVGFRSMVEKRGNG